MLGNGRGAHAEIGYDRSRRLLARAKQLHDMAAGRIGEGGESVHVTIIKVLLNYVNYKLRVCLDGLSCFRGTRSVSVWIVVAIIAKSGRPLPVPAPRTFPTR